MISLSHSHRKYSISELRIFAGLAAVTGWVVVSATLKGVRVGELTTTIQQRLSDAYDSLRSASDTGDDLLADAQRAEIDDLRRIAASHGIDVRGMDVPRCA